MSSLLVARQCTRAAALSLCRRAGALPIATQRSTAAALSTYTYRAPKTISAQQLVAPCRSFWKKAAPNSAVAPATATAAPATSASQESKAERLGFSLPAFSMSSASGSGLTWQRFKTYLVWLSVGGGVLLVFKLGLSLVDTFANISFLDVGEIAFIGGLLSGIGVAACGVLGTRFLRLRPDPIFKHAFNRIASDETVAAYMGRSIKTSDFRAYNFVDSHLVAGPEARASVASRSGLYRYYRPKRLQMMFQVVGSNGVTGMATAEVEKNWRGDHVYNLLSVDLIDGRDNSAAERIILEGDPSYRIYKGIVKLR